MASLKSNESSRRASVEDFAFECQQPAKRKKQTSEDVTIHARKAAWIAAYGDVRLAKCFLCQFNEVGWTNVGFDLAHVVARCCFGNNTELWNRVPVCSTCNQNVHSETNLLDFAAQNYPARVVPLTNYLFEQFCARQPHLAQEEFDKNKLEHFARFLYGSHAIDKVAKSDNPMSLQFFRKRFLNHTPKGAIQSAEVYALLRAHDYQKRVILRAETRIQKLRRDIEALQSIQKTLSDDLETALKEKEKAETCVAKTLDKFEFD